MREENTNKSTPGRAGSSIILFIAQGAFSGRFPLAPGTAGTVVGVLFALLFRSLDPIWYTVVCAAVIVIGVWAAGRADVILGSKDSPSIVIDEIAGFLVSMAFLPVTWSTVAAAFVLFRFFDIFKPWPIDALQRVPGGAGVMLDDLVAGVYTNIVIQVVFFAYGS